MNDSAATLLNHSEAEGIILSPRFNTPLDANESDAQWVHRKQLVSESMCLRQSISMRKAVNQMFH